MNQHDLTLIVGGTGKTGRRVAERLTTLQRPVRVASRTGAPAFDWHDQSTWAASLEGVRAVYIAYYPDLAVPEAAAHIRSFCELASTFGVTRAVLLSGRGEVGVLPSEAAVRESAMAYTILRCAWFSQNFSEGHLLGPVLEGEIAFPAGDVAEPFVDLDDVADVAVAALTDERHADKTYELTGPSLLTFEQAASEITRASARDVYYRPVSSAQYAAVLADFMPRDQVTFLTQLFAEVLDGHNAYLADGVQRALGRSPREFRDFAREAARAGVWSR